MKYYRGMVLFLFLIILASFCIAVPPVQTTIDLQPILTIQYPLFDTYQVNTDLKLNFHVYNSTGYIITNVSNNCTFHLYDREGNHLMNTRAFFDLGDVEFFVNINKNNLSQVDKYSFLVYCIGKENGFLSSNFEITKTGKKTDYTYNFIIILGTLAFTISLLLYFIQKLKPEHELLKGLLILMVVLLIFWMLFIAIFNTSLDFFSASTILSGVFLLILKIFVICFVGYCLYAFLIHLKQKHKSKYNTIRDVNRGK